MWIRNPPPPKPEDEVLFLDPKLSPDGKTLAVVLARRPKPNETAPEGLILLPVSDSGPGQGQPLIKGDVAQPNGAAGSSRVGLPSSC